ncbi:MAG: hypothetical protein H7144_12465 [Burkholderiales bacterium]|nr:hypothetical protein [Phycisphaerae bacterium]
MISASAYAVVLGQTDTFEDATVQGWVVAVGGATSPAPPANIATGGPAGANDNFLQLTSLGGGGAGSRLIAFNLTQWSGNFTTAGITGIKMHLNNSGAEELSLRLGVATGVAPSSTNLAISSSAIIVPAGSGWVTAEFLFGGANLTATAGTVAAALAGATEIRLFHSTSANFPGSPIAATLGVDNVTAVPEPTALGVIVGALLVSHRRWRAFPRT